jgi:Cytochrome oxidase complex assembly protein 1
MMFALSSGMMVCNVNLYTPMPPPIPAAAPKQKDWFSRNWFWLIPGIIVIFAVLVCGGAFALFGAMKSSDAYKSAVAIAQNDPRVIDALGKPIMPGYLLTGNINVTNDSGEADISIPISGPHATGTVHAVATKSGGLWRFSTLVAHIDKTGEDIDLQQKKPLATPAP